MLWVPNATRESFCARKFTSFVDFEQLKIPSAFGPRASMFRRNPSAARSSASSHVAGRSTTLSRTSGVVRRGYRRGFERLRAIPCFSWRGDSLRHTPHSSPIYSRSRVRENWAGRNFQKHSSPLSDRPPMNRIAACALGVSLLVPAFARAQSQTQSGPSRQTEGDAYTRYELLAPGSAKFRIIYEVTATTPGAMYYFNPIRKGSVATDESVSDRATGKPLVFDVVSQAVATAGGVRGTDSTPTYIRVKLSHPVPADGGEARVLILKTYQDSASYRWGANSTGFDTPKSDIQGREIVFTRPLG